MNKALYQEAFETMLATWQRIFAGEVAAVLGQVAKPVDAPKVPAVKWQTRTERAKGEKRSQEDMDRTVELLGKYIAQFPGRGIEKIAGALHLATKDLTLPVKKLLAAKRIRKVGSKRATKYFPR